MAVQDKRLACVVGCRLFAAEDLGAALMYESRVDKFFDGPAGLERGIQLDNRIRPEKSLFELMVDVLGDALVTDDDEATRVVGVVVDETFA